MRVFCAAAGRVDPLRSRATLSMEPKVASAFSTGLPEVAAIAGASAVFSFTLPPDYSRLPESESARIVLSRAYNIYRRFELKPSLTAINAAQLSTSNPLRNPQTVRQDERSSD